MNSTAKFVSIWLHFTLKFNPFNPYLYENREKHLPIWWHVPTTNKIGTPLWEGYIIPCKIPNLVR